MGHDDCLGELLSIGLVASVVLDFDVEIERTLATVDFLAIFVRADVLSINLLRRPSVMLFPVAALQMF